MNNKRIILVTGPPGNQRDEYIQRAIKGMGDVGYYHVFEYMQEVALKIFRINLTREHVFDVPKNTLEKIRDTAIDEIAKQIKSSDKKIEIISTPARFKVKPIRDYYSGLVDGLNESHLEKLDPDMIILFIDDLLRVRKSLQQDVHWRKHITPDLKTLAEWRQSAQEQIENYITRIESTSKYIDYIIFAREHPVETFQDLIKGEKPRVYLSYNITGREKDEAMKKVERIREKLSKYFVCIDPYAIKDWDIVTAYDEALEKGSDKVFVEIRYRDETLREELNASEVESCIDLIRSQIVSRDFRLIDYCHAILVYHWAETPSYGVMAEVIHATTRASAYVYVVYPYKKRLSPFFEHYAGVNIFHGDDEEQLIEKAISVMVHEYKKWPKYISGLRNSKNLQ